VTFLKISPTISRQSLSTLRRFPWGTVLAFLTVLVGIWGVLFGPGILLTPRLEVDVKAFSYPTPERLTGFQALLQMVTASEEVFESALQDTAEELRRSGLREERVKLVLSHTRASLFGSDVADPFSVFQVMEQKLTKPEIRLAPLAYLKVVSRVPQEMSKSFFAMPNAIVQVSVENTGRRDAENMLISMSVGGTCIEGRVQSDNEIASYECDSDRVKVQLRKLSPEAGVDGIFWFYYFGKEKGESSLVVSSNHQYLRKKFTIGCLGQKEPRPLTYEAKPQPSTPEPRDGETP
jgi:hypothetical protein